MHSRVVGLYVHGPRGTGPDDVEPTPMMEIGSVEAVEGMGLREDARYFRRPPDSQERKRQVSLIDEGTIWRLECTFGPIPRATIKTQIILEGEVFLPGLIGETLKFGDGAEILVSLTRKPCYAMDLIAAGLRQAMESSQQGALARVTRTGPIVLNDEVSIIQSAAPVASATG